MHSIYDCCCQKVVRSTAFLVKGDFQPHHSVIGPATSPSTWMSVNSGHQKGTKVLSAQGNWLMSDKPGLFPQVCFFGIQSTCDILVFCVAHSQEDDCHLQSLSLQTETRGRGALSDPHREGFEPPFSENLRWLHSWRPAPNCQSFWFVDFSELPTLL